MKKLLLACAVACAGFTAIAGASYADVSEQMKDPKYCIDNSMDVICMGPEINGDAGKNDGNEQRSGHGQPDKILPGRTGRHGSHL